MTTQKSISLPDPLAEEVDEENLNLSRFVQDKLYKNLDAFGKCSGGCGDYTKRKVSAAGYKVLLCEPCEEKAEQFAEKHNH